MNEIIIKCNPKSPEGDEVVISADNSLGEKLLYKFLIGYEGKWNTLKDFSEENTLCWTPENQGSHIIMVQGRTENSHKPYVCKMTYVVGKSSASLIDKVVLGLETLKVGDKQTASVLCSKSSLMFRFWLKANNKWELLKDYGSENIISFTVKASGPHELLAECKGLDSSNSYDDFKSIPFDVEEVKPVEITKFKCLNAELLSGGEISFEVETSHDSSRMILYKFIKFSGNSPEGQCIQDFSTKKLISYVEKGYGDYKLLCLVKDMYSQKEYDDRAIINFKVKSYREIKIVNFSSDMSSPQVCGTKVTFKAVVSGGRELLYRFLVDGNSGEDTGFQRSDSFEWNTQRPGKYKVYIYVKDSSFDGSYEAMSQMDFEIEEYCDKPIVIKEILLDKKNKLLVNETVNIMAIAEGGSDLRYSFIVHKEEAEVEKINYGSCSWVNFTPEGTGSYTIEIRVKHKYSQREFDAHSFVNIDVFSFIPAEIDYVLLPLKEHYMVGEQVNINIIALNTKKILLKFLLYIDGHRVEETNFTRGDAYRFNPKRSGVYSVEVLAKNIESTNEYDTKKEVRIKIHDSLPVTNTKISANEIQFKVNQGITFTAESQGGKEHLYEFYLMEHQEWNLVQKYSRKNFYTFIPFTAGRYRLLALCKSSYKNCSYEDYDIFEFTVEE